MIFLRNFNLLNGDQEFDVIQGDLRRIYNNSYPFGIFSEKGLDKIKFSNITCFYGENGSGKSTLLNIIAEKIHASRKTKLNKGSYFNLYVTACNYEMAFDEPLEIKIISSDDIFDYLLDMHAINAGVNRKKEYLAKEYLDNKFNKKDNSIEEYEQIRNSYDAKAHSMSKYIRERLGNNNIVEMSNGESALMFWEKEIKENSIYILDEPENSLSAKNQLKLKQFIEESARFYNCQFIISTHSPFLLNLEESTIYDLDSTPIKEKKWTDLENVKIYHNFFKEKEKEF